MLSGDIQKKKTHWTLYNPLLLDRKTLFININLPRWSATSAISIVELSWLEQLETVQVHLQELELLQAARAGAAIQNADKTGLFLTMWVSQAHFGIWIFGLLWGVLIKQFLVFGLILNLRNVIFCSPNSAFSFICPS